MKRFTCRVLSVMLAAVLLIASLPALAAKILYTYSDDAALTQEILTVLRSGKSSVEFYAPKTFNPDYEAIMDTIQAVHPVVSDQVSASILSYSGDRPSVVTLTFSFTDISVQNVARKKAKEVVASVVKSGMSDADKYKALHDWIILNCRYDGATPYDGQSAYDALVDGRGMCAAYARAFMMLCQEAGLPCLYVRGRSKAPGTGRTENHAWNIVFEGYEWKAVDVTWDDPTPDVKGRVVYDYFLMELTRLSETHFITGSYSYDSITDTYFPDLYGPALRLNEMGLFLGSGDGFNLNGVPTRGQGAVMFCRLLGVSDKQAEALGYTHPFGDVPAWATYQVGYLYNKGLTTGTSQTRFSSSNTLSAAQYTTFILRALGYSDGTDFNWQSSLDFALKLGLITNSDHKEMASEVFTRRRMTYLSYNALSQRLKGSNKTLKDSIAA